MNKKNDKTFYVIFSVAVLILIIAAIFKFGILNKNRKELLLASENTIEIVDLSMKKLSFNELIKPEESNYILFMEINNCPSCIQKGIALLQSFVANNNCMIMIVHNWPEELKNWKSNFNFDKTFVIKPEVFYKSFDINYLPALVDKNKTGMRIIKYITI